MALNSDQLQAVYRMSDAGQDNQALSLLAQLHDSAETGEEKAHLLLAESRCLSRLGKVAESQKSLKAVAKLKVSDGATNAASELMSALNFRLLGEHKRALKILTGIPAKYSEVMREHAWFRRDVNAEIAFTKVTLEKYDEAIAAIVALDDESEDLESRQRKLLYLADCYVRTGKDELARNQLHAILS